MNKVRSSFGKFHLSEAGKSLLTGLLFTIIGGVIALADNGKHIPTKTELWVLVYGALISAGSNALRIWGSNSNGKFLQKEPDANSNSAGA